MSFSHASGTTATASLISNTPISSTDSPERSSAFCVAGMGAVSIMTRPVPANVAVCTRASGLSPSYSAFSADLNSSAAEPSEICEKFPA
jgi:hypothetical protein